VHACCVDELGGIACRPKPTLHSFLLVTTHR
jgi:hypothetical protein